LSVGYVSAHAEGSVHQTVAMSDTVVVSSGHEVSAALSNPILVPHRAPQSIGSGETARLRDAMARFSSGDLHVKRRGEVLEVLDRLDESKLHKMARGRAATRLDGSDVEVVAEIAFKVPTESMATALGVDERDLGAIVIDTASVAAVIGRAEPSGAESDRAVWRLLDRFAAVPGGAIAAVSLLYQNHDATAALSVAAILGDQLSQPRRCALAGTSRVATADGFVGETSFVAGQTVSLDLESSGLEFGAGPHECPGADLARAIAAGIVVGVRDAGYELDVRRIVWGSDGRAKTLPMHRVVE